MIGPRPLRVSLLLATIGALSAPAISSVSGAGALASTPASQTVTVPQPGHTVTVRWTGTIEPGSDPTSDCNTAGGATSDMHKVTIKVPAGIYGANTTSAVFGISWKPASGQETSNDEVLTVEDPQGNPTSSDGSDASEAVPLSNPAAGTWTALACGYVNSVPQPYTGTLTLTTTPTGTSAVAPPPATPQARLARTTLKFSHEVVVDHQRDGFEPDNIEAHGANGPIYTSVPSGSSTTTSYIWKSIDHGKSYQFVPGSVPTGRPTTCPQGGGDTELTVDSANNLYFSDLQNLTNLTNGYSTDGGNTFVTSCASVPNTPVDRMWYATQGTPATGNGLIYEEYDAVDSSVSPNSLSNELVAVVSDNGVEFTPLVNPDISNCLGAGVANCVTTNEGIPGNMVLGKKTHQLYIAHSTSDSNQVAVSIGTVSGTFPDLQATWKDVVVDKSICPDYDPTVSANNGKSEMCGASEFATIAQDASGNLYVCFASHQQTVQNGATPQTGPYQVFVVSSTDGGKTWSKPVQVTHQGTNAFSWITAGANGRVAAAWYSSNEASEKGSYVLDDLKHAEFSTQMGVSLDAHSLNSATDPHPPTYQIATVSEHPIKYGSICTAGLGCTLNGGDRSLGDFLEVGHDDAGRLYESYVDDTSSYFTPPTNPQGDNASNGPPVIARQIAGPSLNGGSITGPDGGPGTPYGSVSDASGDAALPALGQRTAAGPNKDLLSSSMSRDSSGLVLRMKVKSLSDLATAPTEGGTTGEWLTTFTTYDPGHAGNGSIYYAGMESVAGGAPTYFVGRPDPASAAAGLAVTAVFDYSTTVPGSYSAKDGTITIHIPFKDLNGHGPKTKLYSVTSFTASALGTLQGNTSGIFDVLDSTPPYDYVVPSVVRRGHASSAGAGQAGGGSGAGTGTSGSGSLAATGSDRVLPAVALALLVAGLVGLGLRRRRSSLLR
jgi:hypothetical protein